MTLRPRSSPDSDGHCKCAKSPQRTSSANDVTSRMGSKQARPMRSTLMATQAARADAFSRGWRLGGNSKVALLRARPDWRQQVPPNRDAAGAGAVRSHCLAELCPAGGVASGPATDCRCSSALRLPRRWNVAPAARVRKSRAHAPGYSGLSERLVARFTACSSLGGFDDLDDASAPATHAANPSRRHPLASTHSHVERRLLSSKIHRAALRAWPSANGRCRICLGTTACFC